jgi:hypothetical protein
MRKVDKNVIEIKEDVVIGDFILEEGDKIKILNETGEWDDYDAEMIAWKEELDDILQYMGDVYSEFKYIPNSVEGFDKYQGPYGFIEFQGKRYKVWTADTNEPKSIFIEDFPYSNTGSNEIDGYLGSAMTIFQEVDMARKGFNKYGFR